MKKVLVVAVMAFGTMTAFAQVEETAVQAVATEVEETVVEEIQATEEAVTEEVVAVEDVVSEEVVTVEEVVETQNVFAEVIINELPVAITEALEAAHPGATIAKAYTNDAAQYKLEVAKEDGAAVELYTDAEGNFIEK